MDHPETETTLVVNDNWMNLPDISQDSTTTQPQNSRELLKAPARPP